MNKDEVLQLWKEVVLELKANTISSVGRIELLSKELLSLNPNDVLYVEKEYAKWFHEVIRPTIPKKILDIVNNK
jgi:hypothetical protein